MVLAGAVIAGGAGGETVCGTDGAGFAGATPGSRSPSWRLRRQSRRREIAFEAHEIERQCLEESMCRRWPPMLNDIERAWAGEPSASSTARKQSSFIKISRG